MGFLEGIAYKLLGTVCVWEHRRERENWTYWSDGILRHRGTFLEQKIKLRRDILRIDEISEDSVEDRVAEARIQLAGNVLSKEHLGAIAGILVLPLLISIPIVLARAKAIDAKDEALRQEALRKLNEQQPMCLDLTLKGGGRALLICLPDVGTKILDVCRGGSS